MIHTATSLRAVLGILREFALSSERHSQPSVPGKSQLSSWGSHRVILVLYLTCNLLGSQGVEPVLICFELLCSAEGVARSIAMTGLAAGRSGADSYTGLFVEQ